MKAGVLALVAQLALLPSSACERRSRRIQKDTAPPPPSTVEPSRPPTEGEIALTKLMESLLVVIQAGREDDARTIIEGFKLADCKAWFESRFQNTAGDLQGETITGDERTVGRLVSECVQQSGGLERAMLEKLRAGLERGWTQVRVESFSTPMDPLATMTQGEALRFARVPTVLYSVRLSGPARWSPSLHLFSFIRDEDGGIKYVGRMTGATLLYGRGLLSGKYPPPEEANYWRRSEFDEYLHIGIGPDASNDML